MTTPVKEDDCSRFPVRWFRSMQEAGNGKEGIRVAKRIKPDLITLDLSLAKIQNAFEMNSTQMGL